ncbi:hypothetical protein D3C80_2203850 [compost metagenome]
MAGCNKVLHIGVRISYSEHLVNVLPGFPYLPGYLIRGPAESAKTLVTFSEFQRG